MPVPSSINDLSTVAGSNYPGGGENPSEGDNYIRALSAFIAQLRDMLNGASGSPSLLTLTVTNAATFNGDVAIGNASSDTLTIAPNAVTWSNNPTHSGNHTYSGNATVQGAFAANGNATLGDSSGDALTVNATTTQAGPLTLSGAVTVNATTGELFGQVYTPTLVNLVNVASSSANEHRYVRLGDFVVLNGSLSVTPTAAGGAATQVAIPLPIASDLTGLYDIRCPAAPDTSLGHTAPFVSADAVNNRAILNFGSGSTGACGWSYTLIYQVK